VYTGVKTGHKGIVDDHSAKIDRIQGLLEEIRAGLRAPPKVWLSPAEAASYLGVSVTRISTV
jgi:hypothetical protein